MENKGTTDITGIVGKTASSLTGTIGDLSQNVASKFTSIAGGLGPGNLSAMAGGIVSGVAGDTIGNAQAQLGKAKELADKLKNIKKPSIPNFKGIKPPPFKPLKEFKQPALPKTKKELKAEKEKLKGMIGKAAGGVNKLKDAASKAQGLASQAQGLASKAQGLASQAQGLAGNIQSQVGNIASQAQGLASKATNAHSFSFTNVVTGSLSQSI